MFLQARSCRIMDRHYKRGNHAARIFHPGRTDGKVRISVTPERAERFAVMVRIPGWAQNAPVPGDLYRYIDSTGEKPTLSVNGAPASIRLASGYVRIERTWRAGDTAGLPAAMRISKDTIWREFGIIEWRGAF